MQNRRLGNDDGRGVGEALNEVDKDGRGIRVPATYYIDVSYPTTVDGESVQRLVQQKTDNPTQIAYNFNVKNTSSPLIKTQSNFTQMSGNIKYVALPIAKNQFMLRVENIGDLYDNAESATINIDSLLENMYQNANSKSSSEGVKFDLTEMAITGNQPLEEMKKNKIQWKTMDDHSD